MPLIKSRTAAASGSRSPSASRFQYKARSAEEVKARASRSIGNRDNYLADGVEFFAPKTGDNTIRMLPPTWEGAKHYGLDLFLHYGIGPDESAYLCLDKMKGERCPLCEERTNANAAGEEGLAKALAPKSRVLVWVIDRKEPNKGPLAWSMAAGLDKDIVNCAIDKSTGEILAIDDPSERGFDVSFKREGEGIKTKYTGIQVARKPSPLSDDPATADAWLNYVAEHPLDSLLQFKDADTLQHAYAGGVRQDEPADKKGEEKGGAPKIPPRGAARQAPAQEPAQPPAGEAEELPSWEEVHAASEADVTELVEVKGLTKEAEADASLDSLEKLQDWVCERLGIAKPAPKAAAAAGGSWKDRLKKNAGK